MELGRYNHLEILRATSVGLYLGDAKGQDVLLPTRYCPQDYKIGSKLVVFVYPDNEGRPVATTLESKIFLHEFAFLRVSAVNEVGAFLDWGLDKELLVPYKEQRQKMEEGRWYVVYLDIDEKTDRLFASNKLEKYLDNSELTVSVGDEVNVLISQKTELGFSVIVNNLHKGLIYANEVFTELNIGDTIKAHVKNIREDNKLDISLSAISFKQYNDSNTELILKTLKEAGGFLNLTDKSPPEEIASTLGISKKAFKKSIGALYKSRKIEISPKGIRLC